MYLIEKEQMNRFEKVNDFNGALRLIQKLIKEGKAIDFSSCIGSKTTIWRKTYSSLMETGKYEFLYFDFEA